MNRRAKIHVILAIIWALLLIPSILIWKDALLWVIFMSLYANFVGHVSSFEAADDKVILARLDTLEDMLEKVLEERKSSDGTV